MLYNPPALVYQILGRDARRRLRESGRRFIMKVESGKWKVESGEWRVEIGEWRVESGEWRVEI